MRLELWGGAFSAEVPDEWAVVELDDVVEIELPGAAVHFSVYGRETEGAPEAGDAMWLVQELLAGRAVDEPVEYEVAEGFAATGSYVEGDGRGTRRVDVGARVSSRRAVVYTYNDDGSREATRESARALFESVLVA